jgi:hypothetical protein
MRDLGVDAKVPGSRSIGTASRFVSSIRAFFQSYLPVFQFTMASPWHDTAYGAIVVSWLVCLYFGLLLIPMLYLKV